MPSPKSCWHLVVALSALLAMVACERGQPDVFPSCGPELADCEDLIEEVFGEVRPAIPMVVEAESYRFASGEHTGQVFLFVYEREPNDPGRLILGVKRRDSDGLEPPDDLDATPATPNGNHYVEREDGGRVRAIDAWSAKFHYALSIEGGADRDSEQHRAALDVIDSLSLA